MLNRLLQITSIICTLVIGLGPCDLQADQTLPELTYTFTIEGTIDGEIQTLFNERSTLLTLQTRPLYSTYALNKRIDDDINLLKEIFYSRGYYDAKVTERLNADTPEIKVHFVIDQGERYRFKSLEISFMGKVDEVTTHCPTLLESKDLKEGDPLAASIIISEFDVIIQKLGYCGYPFATLESHEATLLPESKQANVRLVINPGKFIRFGPVVANNPTDAPSSFILNRVNWTQGDVFDQRKLDKYREKLLSSRLFESIEVDYPEESQVIDKQEVPITVTVKPGKPRSLSAGVKYAVNEGFGANFGWTHRNFMHAADRFESKLEVAQVKSRLGIDYELPDVGKPKRNLVTTVEGIYEDSEAYESTTVGVTGLLRQLFAENSDYYYGLSFERDDVRQNKKTKSGTTLGLPLGLKWDRSDNLLDPEEGYRLNLSLTPKYGAISDPHYIMKGIINGSVYYSPMRTLTMATWARAGSVMGPRPASILANQRFYAGGGGSIRGYGYQMAGPIDAKGDPLGGKSLLEGGIEARFRFTQDWGAVAFLEGGRISNKTRPNLAGRILYGTGVGIRYFTSIGPVRGDLAFPLKRRRDTLGKRVDDWWQFYISIGQGF